MTPPPIRYPLPTLLLAVLCVLIAWKGEVASRPIRESIHTRLDRALAGPPVPSSSSPLTLVGPVVRRVLLREDGVDATDLPDGRIVQTIRLKQFVDLYDVWPLAGESTHLRIGNRKPIGWVKSSEVLDWGTRLVYRRGKNNEGVHSPSQPVLNWKDGSIRVVKWDTAAPWTRVESLSWISKADVDQGELGTWLSREELLAMVGRISRVESTEGLLEERFRAITGQTGMGPTWTTQEREEVRHWLPEGVGKSGSASGAQVVQNLARVNEEWTDEAVWSGIGFRFIPLTVLP